MVYSLNYRRPSFVPNSRASSNGEEMPGSSHGSVASGNSGMSRNIPDALSFDRIISGGTCPPCTIRDFMNYSMYIAHTPENLQFFLWCRDYEDRFNKLPESEKALAPEWVPSQADADNLASHAQRNPRVSPEAAAAFRGTGFAATPTASDSERINPFSTPSQSPSVASRGYDSTDSADLDSPFGAQQKVDHAKNAATTFESAGLMKPFTIQPYREEINRIISIYVSKHSPRELNISSKERETLLKALEYTTHPSAFTDVKKSVEWSLRCQAHPNFIRWSICNGNKPRVLFARFLGVAGIIGGFIAAILLTLSSAGRAWRVMSLIGFFIGIATLIAAWKGMCVVLHGMHHRHLRPWELFASEDEDPEVESKKGLSSESLLSNKSNSFEDEPWVARYEKRNVVRKVFDREVWIQEPALRQIQDTIFIQAILGAFVLSAVAVGVFCAFPAGNFF
ncbi:hypothetical protein BDY21DRAFT_215862 [Lineolata rhizophorae]|uniref:RGS domain-containing protein n=1 Tax=Lineolata rhizophorae TaxID=578093 RepID=A0A6A6P3B2_9PEZI|nr:hypothetical protein BDY21DRAFT_215862 [Lineolata rhizophorae]